MTAESKYPEHIDADEKSICDLIVKAALAAGHVISVYGSGVRDLAQSSNYAEITSNVAATDETMLWLVSSDRKKTIGTVLLVHGNEPFELIADHTDTAEMVAILVGATARAAELEARANRITLTPGWGFGGQTV